MSSPMERKRMPSGNDVDHDTNGHNTRRVFLGRLAGGLAIGVPALQILMRQSPAYAQTRNKTAAGPKTCDGGCPDPCETVYEQYQGHGCGGYSVFNTTCKGPVVEECIGYYILYSAEVTGEVCGDFSDPEGPCSPNAKG